MGIRPFLVARRDIDSDEGDAGAESARRAARTEELEPGLVVDFGRGGAPLGLEIVDPPRTTLAAVNRVLRKLRQPGLTRRDLKPFFVR